MRPLLRMFQQAFARLDIDFEKFTFVDLGAGKGRIMLLASNFPFQRVLGVEFVPELHAGRDAEHFCCISLPPANATTCNAFSVMFATLSFRPFRWSFSCGIHLSGRSLNVSWRISKTLCARDPREVYLVYLKPEFEHLVVERVPSLKKIWESRFTMTDRISPLTFSPTNPRPASPTALCLSRQRSARSQFSGLSSPGIAQAGGDPVDGCGKSTIDGV